MNIFKIFLAAAFTFVFIVSPASVLAQNSSTTNDRIQQRLEDEGLDKAPDVVEVEPRTMQGQEPYSGFVDENGNPLSDEEYAAYQQNQKGFLKKYPWVLVVILLGGAGAFYAIKKRKK